MKLNGIILTGALLVTSVGFSSPALSAPAAGGRSASCTEATLPGYATLLKETKRQLATADVSEATRKDFLCHPEKIVKPTESFTIDGPTRTTRVPITDVAGRAKTVACTDRSKTVGRKNGVGSTMFTHTLWMSWCWSKGMKITKTQHTQHTRDRWVCWDRRSGPSWSSRYGKGYGSWTGISSSRWRCGVGWAASNETLTVRIDAKAGVPG